MFNIGEKAYFIENWTDNIIGGEITETGMTKPTDKHPSQPYLRIRIEGSHYDIRNQLTSKCYPTTEAAKQAQKDKSDNLKNEYRNQIQTVDDLIRFMYNNNVHQCEEYTNWEARAVVREKAKELCGIELED